MAPPTERAATRTIHLFESHTDNTGRAMELTWHELRDLLSVPRVGGKHGPAWSPIELDGPRRIANVKSVGYLVLDLDKISDPQFAQAAQAIEGKEYLAHTTHSHRKGVNCLRVVITISRPVQASEWPRFYQAALIDLGLVGIADPACKDCARLYYRPAHEPGAEFFATSGEGDPLDVDLIMASAAPEESTGRALVSSVGPDSVTGAVGVALATLPTPIPVALDTLRRLVTGQVRTYGSKGDPERAEKLGRVITGRPLAGMGERDSTINQIASTLAAIFPRGVPTEAAVEIMRPSITAMPTHPEGLEHWLGKAAYSYERACLRKAEADALREQQNAYVRSSIRTLLEKRKPKAEGSDDSADPDDGAAWQANLLTHDGTPWQPGVKLQNTPLNATMILTFSEETRDCIRLNVLTMRIEVHGGLFDGAALGPLETNVTDWLNAQWGLRVSTHDVGKRIASIADANKYDPLAEYLNSLTWDNVPRLDTWLETYLNAQTEDQEQNDIRPYLRQIGPRWMISAVARALTPGCKVDTVLVLEGKQGLKKSMAFDILGGQFFSDTQLELGEKDSKMVALTSWIIELAEMSSFRKTETAQLKGFFSARKDKFRLPYSPSMEEYPRRCVFVGTTNEDVYLTDETGNRRYWPVLAQHVEADKLREDRDQLWAEAVARFRLGESWWLSDQEQAAADGNVADRSITDPAGDLVAAWWFGMSPRDRPVEIRLQDVLIRAMRLTHDRIGRVEQMRASSALKALGFAKVRKKVDGRAVWMYLSTQELREAPGGKGPLRLIADSTTKDEGSQHG